MQGWQDGKIRIRLPSKSTAMFMEHHIITINNLYKWQSFINPEIHLRFGGVFITGSTYFCFSLLDGWKNDTKIPERDYQKAKYRCCYSSRCSDYRFGDDNRSNPRVMQRSPFLLLVSVLVVATADWFTNWLQEHLQVFAGRSLSPVQHDYRGIFCTGIGSWLSKFLEEPCLPGFSNWNYGRGWEVAVQPFFFFISNIEFSDCCCICWFSYRCIGRTWNLLLLRILKSKLSLKIPRKYFTFDYIGALLASVFPPVLVPFLGLVRTSFYYLNSECKG